MSRSLLVLALLVVSCMVIMAKPAGKPTHSVSKAAPRFMVDTNTGMIRDSESNRTVLMHGLNVVVKGWPWMPSLNDFSGTSFSESDMALLQSLGFNVIRLGVMWPGVEPARDQYNQSYLDGVRWLVDRAAEYGIYTLVEFHQDVLAQRFCADGAPLWALDPAVAATFPVPLAKQPFVVNNQTGFPDNKDCGSIDWFELYFAEAVTTEFGRLYDVESGTSDLANKFGQYWETVAKTFQSSDGVIGYELINEPFAGDVYKDPELLIPGVADGKSLQPFYYNLSSRIRAVDDRHLIFFEGITWDDFGQGFTNVPGGNTTYLNQSVVSYHYYAPPQLDGPEVDFGIQIASIRKRLGNVGTFLTEFWVDSEATTPDAIIATANAADHFLQSWIGWTYKSFWVTDDWGSGIWWHNGTLNEGIVRLVSRTYAQAIAGIPQSMSFDPTSAQFKLVYQTSSDVSYDQPTEIYLNEAVHYPRGFTVWLLPTGSASWSHPSTNRIRVMTTAGVAEGSNISVIITANQ